MQYTFIYQNVSAVDGIPYFDPVMQRNFVS